jgi:hypothetical protein
MIWQTRCLEPAGVEMNNAVSERPCSLVTANAKATQESAERTLKSG